MLEGLGPQLKALAFLVWQIKTTSPKKYCVRPNTGYVEPEGSLAVQVIMQKHKEYPDDYRKGCRDKFLVQSTPAPHGTDKSFADMFPKGPSEDSPVSECKLTVSYSTPSPPSPIKEEDSPGQNRHAGANEGSPTGDSAQQTAAKRAFVDRRGASEVTTMPNSRPKEGAQLADQGTLENPPRPRESKRSSSKVAWRLTTNEFSLLHILVATLLAFLLGLLLRSRTSS